VNKPITELADVLDEAYVLLHQENLGLNHAEPTFNRVLEVLFQEDDARQWFLKRSMAEIISGGTVVNSSEKRPPNFIDSDLICFVAHATRWSEFSVACENRKSNREYIGRLPGSKDIADMVAEALSDNWEDKDFYRAFST
jgi:hypothetical protein